VARRLIEFSPAARADIVRLRAFLDPKSSAAARRAIDRMMAGLDLLADFPEIGVRTSARFRTFYVRFGKGAYVVRHRIEADAILIARIWRSRERRK
jgi:plasmid stabilization system protein ParE